MEYYFIFNFQGVTDNKQTESHFCLHVESLQPQSDQNRAGFLSSSAVQSSHSLNYPLITLHVPFDSSQAAAVPAKWTPMKKPFPCDVHLFALRALSHPTEYNVIGQRQTKPRREASMIMERAGVECQVQGATAMGCEPNASGQVRSFEFGTKFKKNICNQVLHDFLAMIRVFEFLACLSFFFNRGKL